MNSLGSVLRFVFIAASALLLFSWFSGKEEQGASSSLKSPSYALPAARKPYEFCELQTGEFWAQLTTRGAVLRHFELRTPKYQKAGKPLDVSTTPQPGTTPGTPSEMNPAAPGDHEFRQQLFVNFRNVTSPGVTGDEQWNLAYDSVDWELTAGNANECVFRYQDEQVALEKRVATTGRPYELKVDFSIVNRSANRLDHAANIDTVAWWKNEDVEGKMFRVSPYVTDVECVAETGEAVRKRPDDFDDSSLSEPEFAAAGQYGWYQAKAAPAIAAVSNAYFTHALSPLGNASGEVCQLQIEKRGQHSATPGAFYRARLAYPKAQLAPGESAKYSVVTYVGPKERKVLAEAAGGQHQFLELIDLGFFSSIAKVLVSFLLAVYGYVHSWGIAIIILTVCARLLLFPLSLPGIRTMIKMRELKPEMDAINEKYGDDARAKGLAQMELWRKHGMSPFDQVKGCLPQLATMPVWFALYTTLQTAVELYNIPFLWFPDLSEPDPYFILPIIIGGTFFLQQKLAPMQGDPAQRKMMMYFMPGMFTVFMLFLPAGLGVYMFTNSLLAIGQQQVVELQARKSKGGLVVSEVDNTSPKEANSKRRRKA